MSKLKIETLVGLFVIAGVLAVTYLAVQIGGARFFGNETYTIEARFTNVGGLKVGSDVRVAGVSVGRVRSVRLDPETYAAYVAIDVPRQIELDDDTIASIRTTGLIGDKFVALLPGGSGIPIEPGEILYDTESAVDLESLISRFAFGSVED